MKMKLLTSFFLLVSLLVGCTIQPTVIVMRQPAATAEGIQDSWQLSLSPIKWKVGFNDKSKEQLLIEYIPKQESIDNWSEMVTSQMFYGHYQPSILSQMSNTFQMTLAKDCPSLDWKKLKENGRQVIVEWSHKGCRDNPAQHEITRYQLSSRGLHVLHYVEKTVVVDEPARQKKLTLISQAKLIQL